MQLTHKYGSQAQFVLEGLKAEVAHRGERREHDHRARVGPNTHAGGRWVRSPARTAGAATVTTSTGYGRLAVALLLMGAGMGLAGAPATESIMGALPPQRANIGSAVNDTTRELGGALGVAIVAALGAFVAWRYLPSRGLDHRSDFLGAFPPGVA